MEYIVVTVGLMAIIMAAMAIGVVFQGKELKGSCGGVGGADCICEREGTPNACELPSSDVPTLGAGITQADGVTIYGQS